MKKILGLVALFLCLNACADDSLAVNPEFKTITIGSKKLGFTYSKTLGVPKGDEQVLEKKVGKYNLAISVEECNWGDGEMYFDDSSFTGLNEYIKTNGERNHFGYGCNSKVVKIGKYKLAECILVCIHETTDVRFELELYTTTPKYKIIISFTSKDNLEKIIPSEAPQYFHDSGVKYGDNTSINGWGKVVPAWNDKSDANNMDTFVEKLATGKCESKTAQDLYDEIQEIIKTIKIK